MKFTKLAAAITLALAVSAAQAATATDTFNVTLTVTGTCDGAAFTANTTSDVDFGTHTAAVTSAALQATNSTGTALSVACSKGTVATIGLTPSSASTTGAGSMSNGTDTIAYQLRQPTVGVYPAFVAGTATSAVWGNVAAVNAFTALGNGLAVANKINLPVAANIAAPALDVQADAYIDTVTATLSY